MSVGRSVLFQDCGGSSCGCYPRRPASRHHNMSGARHTANGKEERYRAKSSISWNSGLYVGYLLR